MGASPHRDGLSTTSFPTNVGAGSIEAFESVSPLVVWHKRLRPDLGGPGRFRGGLGQEAEIEVRAPGPVRLSLLSDRRDHPALGLLGGGPGAPAVIELADGTRPHPKSRTTVAPGTPRAHGLSGRRRLRRSEIARDRTRSRRDLRDGYVTAGRRARRITAASERMSAPAARLGVDVGGTFTDLVLHDPRARSRAHRQAPDHARRSERGDRQRHRRGCWRKPGSARPICTASCTAPRWSPTR